MHSTYLQQAGLDVLVIHELREDVELLPQELVCEVHLVGFRVHSRVESTQQGSEYTVWFRVHSRVQSTQQGSEYTAGFRVHSRVQSTQQGSE